MTLIGKCIQACINAYNGNHGTVIPNLFEKQQSFTRGHVEGFFALEEGNLYIAFRGSDGIPDWIDNFTFWQKVIPYREKGTNKKIKVHTGFYLQYRHIRDIIHAKVERHKRDYPEGCVIVTGHSLGGALATLCALDILYNFFGENLQKVKCLTYGAPRVGNNAFRKSFNKRVVNSLRYVNGDDVVCKVPYSWMGYRHVATKIKIGKRKWYKKLTGSTDDHYPQKYLRNV
jgi:triacylglycerol lipase